MSRVFITGDTHGNIDINKLNSKCFSVGCTLTKNDIVIICGDAGFVWYGDDRDSKFIDWISNKPWTTVYVDGNHENFNALCKYPIVNFKGARAHKINDSLYHIIRGEIMTINSKSYFCFGGAPSSDRDYRTENVSWWPQELPIKEEIDNAYINLMSVNNKVDFIITHDVPSKINMLLGFNGPNMSNYDIEYINISNYLMYIYENVAFKYWFAGHYHVDESFDNINILYNDIIEIIDDNYSKFDGYNKILNQKYTREQIKELGINENLFISMNKIDKYENFGVNSFVISFEEFFNKEVSDYELEMISKMYNLYKIKKYT